MTYKILWSLTTTDEPWEQPTRYNTFERASADAERAFSRESHQDDPLLAGFEIVEVK